MRKKFFVLATVASLLTFTATVHASLLDDPSFEAATTGGSPATNSDWVLTVDVAPIQGPAAQFEGFAASDGSKGVWFKPFAGNSFITVDAKLEQTLSSVAAGDYTLTFDLKREAAFLLKTLLNGAPGSMAIELTDGIQTDTFDVLADAPNDNTFHSYVLSLPGVSAGSNVTVTVFMDDAEDGGANPQSVFADNFDLTVIPIPEPASIALVGIGLVGMFLRRRR